MSKALIRAPETAALSRELVELAGKQRKLQEQARADNTWNAYESDWAGFCAWIADKVPGANPLEATQKTVAMYLAWLVDDPIMVRGKPRPRKASAISRAATGILFMRQAQGAPLMRHKNDAIAETLSGIRRKLGVAVQQKLPVTGDDLRLIARTYDATRLQDVRNLAIVLLGWYAANRRSEVVALDVSDVSFEAGGMRLRLRRSKTDQEGAGLEKGVKYAKNPAVCAVRALRRWLDMAKIEDGPLFRGFTRTGQLRASRLSDQVVADVVKDACRRIDLDPERYAGHSLRSGFATTAANKGISLRKIMDQTGHKSERVALGYIRRAELLGDDNPTGGLIDE